MKLSQALRITSGDVLALTGGGGKTTAMFRLADELVHGSMPKRGILTTTSTHIFTNQIQRSPAYVTFHPQFETVTDILPSLQTALKVHGQVLLIGPTDPDTGKASGISPEIIDALAATGRFDVIINEADGSRMHSFKAPAAHEPAIPASTTLVVPVAGLDILGASLNNETVHRAALVSQLSGTGPGQPITTDTIAAVLCHPQGGLKNVPGHSRVIPLLNKVENQADLVMARELAAQLLVCERIEAVAMGAIETAAPPILEVHSRTAAIILAAGGSTRFGSPKQLAPWRGQSFLEQVVDIALSSSARPIIVVLGAETKQSQAILKNKPVEVVINQAWAKGQSTSIQAGLKVLPPNISSALFLLVDLPALNPATIEALIQRYRQTMAPIVWPEFEGQRGNPILFDRTLFPELRQISGDIGGRPLLTTYQDRAERVPVSDQGILQDIDRPEDLKKYTIQDNSLN